MMDLLFNPQGRITAGAFWQGWLILFVINMLLNLLMVYGPPAQFPLLLLLAVVVGLALIYPSVCVYGKRLHDAGKSAWWVLAIFLGAIVLGVIVGIVLRIFVPQTEVLQLQQSLRSVKPLSPEFWAGMQQIQKIQFLPQLVPSVLISLVIAFIVSRLASDSGENRFGSPPDVAPTFN
jgi:uncharacterized membrane protein YhaH (DUF805 family)